MYLCMYARMYILLWQEYMSGRCIQKAFYDFRCMYAYIVCMHYTHVYMYIYLYVYVYISEYFDFAGQIRSRILRVSRIHINVYIHMYMHMYDLTSTYSYCRTNTVTHIQVYKPIEMDTTHTYICIHTYIDI